MNDMYNVQRTAKGGVIKIRQFYRGGDRESFISETGRVANFEITVLFDFDDA